MFWNIGYRLNSPVFENDLSIAELAGTLNRKKLYFTEQSCLCVCVFIYIIYKSSFVNRLLTNIK